MRLNKVSFFDLENRKELSMNDLEKSIEELRVNNDLISFSYEQIVKTFSQVYRLMAKPTHPLYSKLRHLGLSFFLSFIHSENLRHMLCDSLGKEVFSTGRREIDSKRLCMVSPRGISLHWLAGNVPILGLISVTLGLITKNKIIIKLPSSGEDYVSDFLKTFLSSKIDDEFQCVGQAIVKSCIVTRFNHLNLEASNVVAKYASSRVLWGSQDAIDFSSKLQSLVPSELISFGPKLSAAVIDEALMDDLGYERLVTDIVLFQQMACTSPQFIFVKGGPIPKQHVIDGVKNAYERIKKKNAFLLNQTEDSSHSMKKLEYSISLSIKGYKLHSKPEDGLIVYEGEPDINCFGYGHHVVGVTSFENEHEIRSKIPANIQGVYYVYGDLEELFNQLGDKVDRIAPVGQAHSFELPWDGLNVLDKLSHKSILWRNN
ncbi:hypothetical protein HOG98_09320 [bacterium]|jgi:hypothetical protein|nr:hypothetical protein [bacterium]